MSEAIRVGAAVDLDNCDREPIHITGAIQPHGALLAVAADGTLAARSANAQEMLGPLPAPGERFASSHLTPGIRENIQAALDDVENLGAFEAVLPDGLLADFTLHMSEGLLLVEIEPRPEGAPPMPSFAADAQRALDRIQRASSMQRLLQATTEEIAKLTGFDRVMAYRFRHDNSGEVVAETRGAQLEPYLGLRYPASDIPAQARRLFTLNPLRFIVDMRYRASPIEPDRNPRTGTPIDLSHSVLRSVSPIHVEYLTNMGVRASMGVSVVVGGKLWGLFSCHHCAPLFVPHAVRKACQLLAQVVAILVERNLANDRAAAVDAVSRTRERILERAKADDDMVRALAASSPGILDFIESSGAAVAHGGQVETLGAGAPSRENVARIVTWLTAREGGGLFRTQQLAVDTPELAALMPEVAGLLAIRYGAERNSFVIWFRSEELATVRWAGRPDEAKRVTGPLGARLSPRGSFAEWKEEVRGRSAPWLDSELENAEDLRRSLLEISAARMNDVIRARDLLLAVLGHDLRNPLQAITTSVHVLRGTAGTNTPLATKVQNQIASSSGRMARLIAHVLDASRIQAGHGMGVTRSRQDVSELLWEAIREARAAHPGIHVEEHIEPGLFGEVDPDRMGQVISNLLSNARNHGTAGRPVSIEARAEKGEVVIRITNDGGPIPPETMARLFQPFKAASFGNVANPQGLGLGLYIASTIVREHGGRLESESKGGRVTFTVSLSA